jgi:hypothetical protein
LYSKAACSFARGMTAHAVGYKKKALIIIAEKTVFVILAYLSGIREPE